MRAILRRTPGREVSEFCPEAAAAFVHELEGLRMARLALDRVEDPDVLLLQRLEVVIELFVPGVEDAHLEAQSGAGDDEVGDGDGSGDDHFE